MQVTENAANIVLVRAGTLRVSDHNGMSRGQLVAELTRTQCFPDQILFNEKALHRHMKCPKCRLENPPSSENCDCGYSFQTGRPGRKLDTGKQRFVALASFANGYKILGAVILLVLLAVAVVMFFKLPDQPFAMPVALGCLIVGISQFVVLTAIGEAIHLFIDIAEDVRYIATK